MLNNITSTSIADVMKFCIDFCDEHNIIPLYITKFGSHLYGTASETSDADYKVLYLPNIVSLLTGNVTKFSALSTGNDTCKNTNVDIDVEFYSLQTWLHNVKRGDTGALDILFSLFRKDTQVYYDEKLDNIKLNYKKLFNAVDAHAFIRFVISQTARYSTKGDRFNAVKRLHEFIELEIHNVIHEEDLVVTEYTRVNDVLPYIQNFINTLSDNTYVKVTYEHGPNNIQMPYIIVLGKAHLGTISFNEFKSRVATEVHKYEKRANKAAINGVIDYKALSHTLRVCVQMRDLLTTEFIKFPLSNVDNIMNIKYGKLTLDEVYAIIDPEIENVNLLLEQVHNNIIISDINYDEKIVTEIILNFYREENF